MGDSASATGFMMRLALLSRQPKSRIAVLRDPQHDGGIGI
jgi:hypothetical protein